MKNILKKFIVIFSLVFVLFGYNFAFAVDDATAPVVTFIAPTSSTSLIISIDTFSALDEIGVTGYNLSETSELPQSAIWLTQAPASYTFSSAGSKTLYAWAKDEAGNVSIPVSNTILISDVTAPEIDISDISLDNLKIGETYNDTTTAIDDFDGPVIAEFTALDLVYKSKIGSYLINYTATDSSGNVATASRTINVSPAVNLTIRDNDNIIFSQIIPLPLSGTVILKDNMDISRSVNSQSVLAILSSADISSSDFNISNLKYYEPYNPLIDPTGSLYLKCIADITGDKCDNWQFTVDNSYPYVGMDKEILNTDKDAYNVYVYFGQQNKFELNSNNINTNNTLTIKTEKYDYQNNIWLLRTGVTVGITQPDPNNPWSPIEIQTNQVDSDGNVIFLSIPEGEYDVGVKEDGYWPTEKLTVTKYAPSTSGGGGSYTPPVDKIFSTSNALNFLSQNQNSDGSFGSPMYTDWAAVAAAAGNNSSLKSSILNYLKLNPINSTTITDYERRAIALMALGVNPYTGTDINYIKKITDSFDGTQFGDLNFVNDDIFGLIVLKNAGYSENDEIIIKDINYIISKQSNSSWGSIDMTAAGIQSLRGFENIEGVSDSISRAESYLIYNQKSDWGFENSFSSSWALQSLFTNNNILKSENYLSNKQQTDGGLENTTTDLKTRIWATSYAIPAILHKSWSQIMNNFSKPEEINYSSVEKEEELTVAEIKEIKVEDSTPIEEPLIIAENLNNEINIVDDNKIKDVVTEVPVNKNIVKQKKIAVESELNSSTQENNENNSLAASAALAGNSSSTFLSTISYIIDKITYPFVWLFIHLGF